MGFWVLLFFALLAPVTVLGQIQTPQDQVQALINFYKQVNGPNWITPWNLSAAPCLSWAGVGCNSDGDIISIDLGAFGLAGELPSLRSLPLSSIKLAPNSLSGTIPTWLCEMGEYLTRIDLSYNQLYGTIPDCLGNLTQLTYLFLQSNNISGTIPSSLFKNISQIDVSHNHLHGSINPGLNSVLFVLLNVGYNQLSGEFPLFNLNTEGNPYSTVDLSNNNFTGTIPLSLGHKILGTLNLANNNFYGELPKFQPLLENLDISGNKFSGVLDLSKFGYNLQTLSASNNNFSSFLPADPGSTPPLSTLDISHNSFNIPFSEFADQFFLYYQALVTLDVSYNQFYTNATLILNLNILQSLTSFLAQNNSLDGKLQIQFSNPDLVSLDLSGNHFTGDIGPEISQPPALKNIYIEGNSFVHSSGNKSGIPSYMYADFTVATLYPDYNFSCPQIKIVGSNATLFTEPSYYGWELCKCYTGYRRMEGKRDGLPANFTCNACESGLTCPGGLQDSEFEINVGYWASPNFENPQKLLPCSTCTIQANRTSTYGSSCEANYEGRLCSQCVAGYFRSNFKCHKCEPLGWTAIACSIFVLLFLVVIVNGNVLNKLTKKSQKDYNLQASSSLSSQGEETSEQNKNRDLAGASIYIWINYCQTISALSQYFTLPASVGALVAAMRVASFATGSGLGFECFSNSLAQFKYYYLAIMLEPGIVVAASLLLYLLGKPFQLCKLGLFSDWGAFCTKICLYALNLLFFPVVSTAGNAFRCDKDPVIEEEYNSMYPYSRCDEVPLGARIAALVGYGGGITCLFFIIVVVYMRNPNPNRKVFKCASFFFDAFQDRYTLFSILLLFRRLAISLLISTLPINSSISFVLNSLVLTVFQLIIVYTKPYKSKTDNDLEIVLGSLLMFAYGIALVVSQPNMQYGAIPMEVLYFVANIGAILWCLYEICRRFIALPFIKCPANCMRICGSRLKKHKLDIEIGEL